MRKANQKLFISQPMNGKSDSEILCTRMDAIAKAMKVLGDDVEVLDSYFQDAPTDTEPLWYLGESLKLLAEADAAYFADGWAVARGCKIEHDCATAYGINIIHD